MNILVGYDGTKSAKRAIDIAVQMAKAFDAFLYIVNSVSIGDGSKETFEFIEDDSKKNKKKIETAEIDLKEAAGMLDNKGIPFQTRILNQGVKAGEDIVCFAAEVEADFIVIGIRRKSKLGKLIFGSTAQYVILHAACSVVSSC